MTEDMRERGVQSKWNELFVVETDRGEWIDMAGEGGWSAFSLLSEAQEIADSEDEPCKIVRFVRQAALSSAGTSARADDTCLICGARRGDSVRAHADFEIDMPHPFVRRDSLSGKGEAPWVCNVCGAAENTEGLFPLCTNGDLHRWAGKALRCVSSSSAGSAESSSTSTTTRNSAEATAIPPISTNTPAGTAAKNSESSAPDRAEELAQDKFAELRSFLTNMRRDAADAEDPELSEYAQAIEQRLDELASLLREAMGRE